MMLSCAAAGGCTADPSPQRHEKILAVEETESWVFDQLSQPAYVVRTEHNVPHIYAANRTDLGIVLGFVMARDRFFMMDLSRRLGQGTLSELLGDAALDADLESRGSGLPFVAAQIEANLTDEHAAYLDAFVSGINTYIDQVEQDEVEPPSETTLASILLGVSNPSDVMEPFDRLDAAAMLAVVLYQSSYETGDVGRAITATLLPFLFPDAPFAELRRQGAAIDLWQSITPLHQVASVPPMSSLSTSHGNPFAAVPKHVEVGMLKRLAARQQRQQKRLNRDRDAGYGSNTWAVHANSTVDGRALLAGDGHLSLSVPSILYRLGLDTALFGDGDIHQLGATIPGLPLTAIGTNGDVAWSQTQLSGDITDWYVEQLQLDAQGYPARHMYQDEWRDLVGVDEIYDIADVELLDSVGRSETWTRWETFDGRWLADIEGRAATADEVLAPGEVLVNMGGDYIVPEDVNEDGIVTGISFDYAGFDAGHVFAGTDAIGRAADVYEFTEAARRLVAYSQNFAVADSNGDILYGGFQGFPCRGYLARNPDGSWADGADPNLLLDGNVYGGFEIPVTADGVVDDSAASDPYRCAVPHDALPQIINPVSGYVMNANNDPTGATFDNSLTNDEWYLGGPWNNGFRAKTINEGLEEAIAEGTADMAKMSVIQGATDSSVGKLLADNMLAAITYAQALASPTDAADQRIAALYDSDQEAIDEVQSRLQAWTGRGYKTPSGVETVYGPEVSSSDHDDAVATMIFNAWMSRVLSGTFNDEGLPGVFHSGTHGRLRALDRFLRGRGDDNPLQLASHNADTGESIFFDVLSTTEVETSNEVIIQALLDALTFLRSEPSQDAEPGTGGFATDDMAEWLWGLRHQAKLESLLADFIGADSEFASITESFAVTTKQIPLVEGGVSPGDARFGLKWFPRPGDQYAVDAANPGTSGTSFTHSSGPVMRMVIAPSGDDTTGVNIIPGGQSAITDSVYFADQARLWLANETTPMRFSVDRVVEGALGRESYLPR